MNQFTYSAYRSTDDSIKSVLQHMANVQQGLSGTDLHNLIFFNQTYAAITQLVSNQLMGTMFDDPRRLEQFDICFSHYYFHALHAYVHNEKTPPAWKICFDYCKRSNASPVISMAFGINAHVNNDLSQALFQTNFGPSYQSDHFKITGLIQKNTPHIIASLYDTDKMPWIFSQRSLLFYFALDQTISNWRKKAWTDYQKLQQQDITIEDIQTQATTKAKQLLLFSR